MLVVQKYGGSSLATPGHIRRAAEKIAGLKRSGVDVVVVASAMGHTTDHLLKLAHKTVPLPAAREVDMLLTAGERISMSLLSMALQELGIPAISFTGSQSGIITTNDHRDAKIIDIRPHRIQEELQKGRVVIIAGFQGVSETKEITTLGRGGSDTTAVALAAILGANRCEILTDVDGLFTADPRIVPDARIIEAIDYDSALEMASLGAKMQARSIEVAKNFKVPVQISSSSAAANEGTLVGQQKHKLEQTVVTGVTTKDGFSFFQTVCPLTSLIVFLDSAKIPLRFLIQNTQGVSFLCEKERVADLKQKFLDAKLDYTEMTKVSIVSIVGIGIGDSPNFLARILEKIEVLGGGYYFFNSNSLSFTIAVDSEIKSRLATALHKEWMKPV